MTSNELKRIAPHAIALGLPLRRSVYSANGDLLLSKGFVIESEEQIESLINNGFFRAAEISAADHSATASGSPVKSSSSEGTGKQQEKERSDTRVAMDQIRWQIGEALILHQQEPAIRYPCRLIGYIKHQTIMVTMPVIDDKFVLIRDNQVFIVRAFSGKTAYAFSTSTLKSIHTPFPYLHLSYPKDVSCAVIRRRARIPVNIIAAAALKDESETIAALVVDMNLGGASAIIKRPFGEVGARGRIAFKINAVGEAVMLDLETIVRSITQMENGSGWRHGYEFVDLSMQDRLVLSAFFHNEGAEFG